MKKLTKISYLLFAVIAASFFWSSCQKNEAPGRSSSASLTSSAAFTNNQALVIAASATDTIYAVNTCHHGDKADTIAFSALPDTIGKYLTDNYSGFTFKHAYKISTGSGTLEGYVVMITYDNNPVGLLFDANGVFVRVLEQRERGDLNGRGWHEGGCFDNRDGHHRDTIAITSLPVTITTYFSSNYPSDTLKHVLLNRDSSYVVVSVDNGVFVTQFTNDGTFIKRVQVYPHVITHTALAQSDLPANVGTYLTTTYPAYVFDAAYTVKLNGTVTAYLVFIDANTTKYLVRFDASGNFVKAITLH
ncbi:MAG TPA: PepSY-like domain-containing protein [Mucilaginibacter sp.]